MNAAIEELARFDQWVTWQYELRHGKPTKVPYTVRNGHRAAVNRPDTWCSFPAAADVVSRFDGLGFVLTPDDPYVGIDVDHLTWRASYDRLLGLGVKMSALQEVVGVGPGVAHVRMTDGSTREIETDSVVFCSKGTADRGRVEIEYFGAEDFDRITGALLGDG